MTEDGVWQRRYKYFNKDMYNINCCLESKLFKVSIFHDNHFDFADVCLFY